MSLGDLQPAAHYPVPHAPTELDSCQVTELPVTVSGHDLMGLAFVDQCSTTAISPHGAIIAINRTLGPDQEVFLRYGTRERLARVIGHSAGGNYGLCFLRQDHEFWADDLEIKLPGEGPLDTPAPEIASDPLLVPEFEQFAHTPHPKPAERQAERRRSPRITMRMAKACVEGIDRSSEIVELINVSRGGICFRSHRVYPLHCTVRVSAPYTEGSTNLFVAGRIVRVHRDSWGGVYGVEYTR